VTNCLAHWNKIEFVIRQRSALSGHIDDRLNYYKVFNDHHRACECAHQLLGVNGSWECTAAAEANNAPWPQGGITVDAQPKSGRSLESRNAPRLCRGVGRRSADDSCRGRRRDLPYHA
jgi:hypothetical protein